MIRLQYRAIVSALSAALLAGCGSPTDSPTPAATPERIAVYATGVDDDGLETLLTAYTGVSGANVIVRRGSAEQIAAAALDGDIEPPVDVVFTSGVAGIFEVAEEGALRPLEAHGVDADVPAWARDPDGFWTGLAYRYAAALYHADLRGVPKSDDFRSLAEPGLRGQLCLSAFDASMNRVIVANLIDRLGERGAELTVRGWIANLALPPLQTEKALIAAVETGTCPVGIASSSAFEQAGTGLAVPARAHVDVAAAGIGRHAANPAAAAAFIAWLLGPDFQQAYAALSRSYPLRETAGDPGGRDFQAHGVTDVDDVARVGWRLDDARRLAQRAGWD